MKKENLQPQIPKTTSELIQTDPSLWHDATHHPFLDQVRQGTLSDDAFSTWLVQDYHFVSGLLVAQSLILSHAPRPDQSGIIGGLVALEMELTWFEQNAGQRSLELTQALQPTCRAYIDFLLALSYRPYLVQITSLWAVEKAYLDAWTTALPCQPKYQEFVEHWTVPEFHDYVEQLEAAANRGLEVATIDQRRVAQEEFRQVAVFERDFWQMAFEGSS